MNYKVKLTFTEPLLGAIALDPDVYAENGGGVNAPDEETLFEELGGLVEETPQKGLTGFMRLPDGSPFEFDYVLKGYFKDACQMIRRVKDSKSAKLTSFKKVIDGLLFISPRKLVLHLPLGSNAANLEILSRPLRAQTAQGERIALAHSETCPVGTWVEFEIATMGEVIPEALIREWLEYGSLRGLRQWRNAGYGRFQYEMERLG